MKKMIAGYLLKHILARLQGHQTERVFSPNISQHRPRSYKKLFAGLGVLTTLFAVFGFLLFAGLIGIALWGVNRIANSPVPEQISGFASSLPIHDISPVSEIAESAAMPELPTELSFILSPEGALQAAALQELTNTVPDSLYPAYREIMAQQINEWVERGDLSEDQAQSLEGALEKTKTVE